MYWYASHLGYGLYSSQHELDLDDLYCDQCGDYDEYIGEFETEEEAEAAYRKMWGWDDEEEE